MTREQFIAMCADCCRQFGKAPDTAKFCENLAKWTESQHVPTYVAMVAMAFLIDERRAAHIAAQPEVTANVPRPN